MKCLMPLNQRQVIAEAIEGKRYVEWGVGGTTEWLGSNALPDFAYSIDHDVNWFKRFENSVPDFWGGRCVPISPGQNATIGEESAVGSNVYAYHGARIDADVYLIDGVVRGECLRLLVSSGRPMTIFLHDTQRDWYDAAIQEAIDAGFERTDYPEGEDYPGCLLTKLEKKWA